MFNANKRAAVIILVLSATGCAVSPGDRTETERSGTVAQGITTVSAVNRIAGDFNGDQIADALVVTPTGVTEYLGVDGGGLNPGWTDSSITEDALLYVGDFNGDGVSDFIVADRTESREYLGFNGALGGFVGPVWSRSDLAGSQRRAGSGPISRIPMTTVPTSDTRPVTSLGTSTKTS